MFTVNWNKKQRSLIQSVGIGMRTRGGKMSLEGLLLGWLSPFLHLLPVSLERTNQTFNIRQILNTISSFYGKRAWYFTRVCLLPGSSHALKMIKAWFTQAKNTLKFSLVCSSTLMVSTSKGQACKWNWFPVSQTSNSPYKMRIRAVSSGLYVIKV